MGGMGSSIGMEVSLGQDTRARTRVRASSHIVRHEQYSPSAAADLAHLSQTFFLERKIANGENFIDHQDLRIEMCGHSECQPHIHPAGVVLHESVEKFFDFCKRDDPIETPDNLRSAHSQDCPFQKDAFLTSKLRVKSSSDFTQASQPAAIDNHPFCRTGDPRQNF